MVIGIIILLLLFLYCFIRVVIPMYQLYKAIKDVDFTKTNIDFTRLDRLTPKGAKVSRTIIHKFKSLTDVLCDRITEVNTVTDSSERDGLTGCYNIKHLENVKYQYEQANNFIIIFIDVNNLKRMNDTFGHEAGDKLIINAAQKLQFWDKYGEVYRMGGDEFMITIKNIPSQQVKQLLNTWYPTVGVLNRASDGFRCVLSCGVAEGSYGTNFDIVQKLADDRMYNMKVAIKKQFGEPMR